jgi:hypothetical protein
MKRRLSRGVEVLKRRGFWLRYFLGSAWLVAACCSAAVCFSQARIQGPEPIHLWRLHGLYVNETGDPIGNVKVALSNNGRIVATSDTDAAGRFEFSHVSGHFTLQIAKSSDHSSLMREVIVGVETATIIGSQTIYVIAGPAACSDDCSSVFTSKGDFEKAVRRNVKTHHQE